MMCGSKQTISHTIRAYDIVCQDILCRMFDLDCSLGHRRSRSTMLYVQHRWYSYGVVGTSTGRKCTTS